MGDSDIPHGRRGRAWNSVSVKNALGAGMDQIKYKDAWVTFPGVLRMAGFI